MKTYNIPKNVKGIIFDIDGTLYTNVKYVFEQVDVQVRYYARLKNISVEEAIEEHIEWDRKRGTGGSFMYFEKPEVPYTIHKVQTDPKYSRRRKDLCKYANRLVRTRWKQYGEVYQHNEYKKVLDVAWELD